MTDGFDALKCKPGRSRYQTLVLISVPRHLDGLDPRAPDTLVVATEWLAWHEARRRGFDAVHFECAEAPWPTDEAGPPLHLPLSATAWIWCDGADATLYRGVSLGRYYSSMLGTIWQAMASLRANLAKLVADLRPQVLVLLDVSIPFELAEPAAKRALIADIAAEAGARVEDRLDPPLPDENAFPVRTKAIAPQPGQPPTAKTILRDLLGRTVETVFRLRLLGRRRRPRVFLSISELSLRRMVPVFDGKGIVPMIPFGASPKSWDFLRACWRNGIWPVRVGHPRPNAAHADLAARMVERIESQWRARPAGGLEGIHRHAVRSVLFAPGTLPTMMANIDRMAELLDRMPVRRVVTGDSGGPTGRMMAELALARGIEVDETLNGVFVLPIRNAPRCGDRTMPPTVTRELAQGPVALDWLAAQGSPVRGVVTGYPALGELRPGPITPPLLRRALLLPGYAYGNDIEAMRSTIVSSIIETVTVLAGIGFEGIRLKLHPDKDNLGFYRRLVDTLHLPCDVIGGGRFKDHMDWADVIIGPLGSSTFLETLAAGKPFYVMRPLPSSIPDGQPPGAVVVNDAVQLAEALTAGRTPDRDRLLDFYCGLSQVGDAARTTWTAIAEAALARNRPS